MIKLKLNFKSKILRFIRKLALKWARLIFKSYPLSSPLSGDRCIEYAFVIKNLINLDRGKHKTVLDIGCRASPLTTIIKEFGFTVDGIDLLPSPVSYENIKYICGDFLSLENLRSSYDVVVLCSTIEHIGLGGRYGSKDIREGEGDIKTLEKVKKILSPDGILILTIPYGEEKTIRPLHRVYNKNSKLLKYTYENFEIMLEEFYKNNSENIWVKCTEIEAREVIPSEDNYALGLFVFKKKDIR